MEYFADKICLTGTQAMQVIPTGTFKSLINRGKISNIAGKACFGNPAMYPVDNFPQKYKIMLYEAFPQLSDESEVREVVEEQNQVLANILPDPNARTFFADYLKENGAELTIEEKKKYENSAMILNAMWRVYNTKYSHYSRSGNAHKFRKGETWQSFGRMMPAISAKYVNSLPHYWTRLQKTAEDYAGNNYKSLLSGRIGNKNRTKKQRRLIEQIVISIYGSKDKPFMSAVTAIYNEFVLGLREIYNYETGEIFNRADFYRKGEPDTISESMVFNILNKPLNRKIVDRLRNDFNYNQNKHNAAVARTAPYYSLSKISMDDRDLRRKCIVTDKKGNKTTAWVHAYYAFDVASDTCIGAAYSLKKDTNLVYDCFRNMWNNLRNWGLKMPYEVEVENHLMKELSEKLDRTFMHTTFCAPMNSREKRAEHKIRAKVWFGEESERSLGMARGRHYARHEAYSGTREKVFDELNDTYKDELEAWDFERLVAEDRAHIKKRNNLRHTRKKEDKNGKKTNELLYKGMTCFEVLQMKQHTQLAPLNWRQLCKEWGKVTETSLKQGRSFTVDYREWWLSDVALIERFKPNNTNAQAYYIPNNSGMIDEIFVYQDDRFIDSPRDLGRFQEAVLERTEEDERIMHEQLGYLNSQKKLAKDAKAEKHIGKIGSIKTETLNAVIAQTDYLEPIDTSLPVAEPELELVEDYGGWQSEDWAAKAVNSM